MSPGGDHLDDLVTWLRAQIAEDRTAALACAGAPWVDTVPGMVHVDPAAIRDSKWTLGRLGYVAHTENSPAGDAYRAHIARHDPRAALAQCSAYTAILDEHEHVGIGFTGPGMQSFGCRVCSTGYDGQPQGLGWCTTVRAVALAYQHCPGFREEWR